MFSASDNQLPGLRLIGRVKSTKQVCSLIILVLAALYSGTAYAGEISLLAPFETKSILMSRNKIIDIVVKVTEAKDLDRLFLVSGKGGRAYDPTGRYEKDGNYYVHYSVYLKKGVNDFILEPARLPIAIKYIPLSSLLNLDLDTPNLYLFHKNDVIPAECGGCHEKGTSRKTNELVAGFAQVTGECYSCHRTIIEGKEWTHFPAGAQLCGSCHQAVPGKTQIAIPSGRIEKVCFSCHTNKEKWLEMEHIHGPVGTGDCTICHDPHGSNSEFQLWTDGKAKLCVICHQDKKEFASRGEKAKLQIHGILSARGCVACHSPHAAEHRYQLRDEINELCVSCHTGLAELNEAKQGHPVQQHPLTGVADPRRPDTPFSCTSCHNPHGTDFEFLLIGQHRGGLVCMKCHSNPANTGNRPRRRW